MASALRKTLVRDNGKEFCALEVEIRENHEGRSILSICGTYGYILTEKQAEKEALEYWISFFEESPEEIKGMNRRCGTRFRSPTSAARYVVLIDGRFHGLDVFKQDGDKVYITTGCGQIQEEIAQWFPEAVQFFPYHLNDMHAECVHQEARGESYKTHPDAICPDCGYKLGSAWTYRPLPDSVLTWFASL